MLLMRIGYTLLDSYQYGKVRKTKLFYRFHVFTHKYVKTQGKIFVKHIWQKMPPKKKVKFN